MRVGREKKEKKKIIQLLELPFGNKSFTSAIAAQPLSAPSVCKYSISTYNDFLCLFRLCFTANPPVSVLLVRRRLYSFPFFVWQS